MKLWISRRHALGLIAAAPALRAFADDAAAPSSEERERMDDLAHDFLATTGVPGLSVAFAYRGSLAFASGYGLADKGRKDPVTVASVFRVASVSKMFTAAAIYKLIAAGKLSLDDRVFGPQGVLPRFKLPEAKQDWLLEVRIQHLLTHTSGGWGNKERDPMFVYTQFQGDALIQRVLTVRPPEHKPGENFAYSNFGYYVLGRVIEARSGMAYEDAVRSLVLTECGITNMYVGNAESDRARHEVQYYGGPAVSANDPHRKDACGGWVASPGDLLKFAVRMDGKPTPPDLFPAPVEKQIFAGTEANPHYGSGWVTNDAGVHWHNGSLPGTASIVVITPRDVCWAAVMNDRGSGPGKLGPELDKLMWKMARSVPGWGLARGSGNSPAEGSGVNPDGAGGI